MEEKAHTTWDELLQEAGRGFRYPPTPDISASVMRSLASPSSPLYSPRSLRSRSPQTLGRNRYRSRYALRWAALAILLLVGALMAVPPVRAQILEFIQIGVVRIFLNQPAPPPQPSVRDRLLVSVLELPGATTLAEAQDRLNFQIKAPAYPPDLGRPDKVFLQNLGGDFLVLVWLVDEQPDQVRFSLHQFGRYAAVTKKWQPTILDFPSVNGQEAVWAEGPYLLQLESGQIDLRRLITGRVLIWTEGEITYRLETDLPLEEALKIAESLEPIE